MIYVLTHYTDNWQPIADITVPVLEKYCNKHGYKLDVRRVVPYEKYNGLEKLNQIKNNLKEDGDIALVLDADTLITNHNIKVEDFLEDEKDLYFSYGLNMGVFIVKKSKYSDGVINKLIDAIGSGKYNCEQDAINDYFFWVVSRTGVADAAIGVLHHPCFNSFIPELYRGIEEPEKIDESGGRWIENKSFILHLPALGLEKRIEIMKNTPILP